MKKYSTSLLRRIENPGRYFSPFSALNREHKSGPKILIVFPDLFEVAQSHTGIKILYSLFQKYGALCDFSFAFKNDAAEEIFDKEKTLRSHTLGIEWKDFDMIAVSFQYQLAYPAFIKMLKTAGIEPLKSKRDKNAPLIMAGGPVMCNPMPVSKIVDATFIGELEPFAKEVVDSLKHGSKEENLKALSTLPPIFNPDESSKKAVRAIAPDMDNDTITPVDVPFFGLRTVHDKFTVEIQRGCSRGCRFCMAGMFYRPHREKSADNVTSTIENNIYKSGAFEAGFLSLSAGDHSQIEELLTGTFKVTPFGFSVTLPSLRTETITPNMLCLMKQGRQSGFTLAPESGSERLRKVINKGNTTEDLLKSVHKIFKEKWQHIKLYFMLGLPTETMEDLEETVTLISKICGIARGYHRKNKVTASFSTFVPQPFTPFQWERMITIDEIKEKQWFIISSLRGKHNNLKLDWHDREISTIEGILSRAGDNVADALVNVAEKMRGLQTWDETFDYQLWIDSCKETGVEIEKELGSRDLEKSLPYEVVDMKIKREFLLKEREKAYTQEMTEDCAITGICTGCGSCDFKEVKPILKADKSVQKELETATGKKENESDKGVAYPYLLEFSKTGYSITLGHLDTVNFLTKILFSIKAKLLFSSGFHPMPRISISNAVPVGVTCEREFAVIWFTEPFNENDFINSLNSIAPDSGMDFLKITLLEKEEVKKVEKAIRNELVRTKVEFENESDINNIELLDGLEIEKIDNKTVVLNMKPEYGSIFKRLTNVNGDYSITRLGYFQ